PNRTAFADSLKARWMRSDGRYHHRMSESWSVTQLLDDASGEEFLDLTIPKHWLTHPGARVLLLIVSPSVANEHAAHGRELLNQPDALHGTWNSATLRTHGIAPLVRSA